MKKNTWKSQTFLKYLLSYFLICALFIIGAWYVMKDEITVKFMEKQAENLLVKVDAVSDKLDEELIFLSQIDSALKGSEVLFKYCYDLDGTDKKSVKAELQKYDISSQMISTIVYKSRKSEVAISTQYYVRWEDDKVVIILDSTKEEIIEFDPREYLECNSPQLICIHGKEKPHLIYFPKSSGRSKDSFFYILNLDEICFKLKMLTDDGVTTVVLVDEEGRIIERENENLLMQYEPLTVQNGGQNQLENGETICVGKEIMGGHRLIALLDEGAFEENTGEAMRNAYVKFSLLSLAAFVLVYFAMKSTYWPLHRLTEKIVKDKEALDGRHLNQLENIFGEISVKNKELSEKLDKYKKIMQKSLLEKLMYSEAGAATEMPDLDPFFDENLKRDIFIVRLYVYEGRVPTEEFQKSFCEKVLNRDAFVTLRKEENDSLFLINYVGEEADKGKRIKEFLNCFCELHDCYATVSVNAESPLDIPALYENIISASMQWPQVRLADGALVMSETDGAYPYDMMNELSHSLTVFDFQKARNVAASILRKVDQKNQIDMRYQNYYMQNLLLGVLWNIVGAMNESNIEFNYYSDTYYEILYSFRSCDYFSKIVLIKEDIMKLLNIYENVYSQKVMKTKPLRNIMEEKYCEPEFSIAVLAEQFQVSVSYMSYQFKKEMNVTFSEYLWKMRFEKAKELLLFSDKTVDEVAGLVGYYSRTSFIKKFKQETGVTPTEFRKKM